MRLDHFALRVPDRHAAAELYVNVFGYRIVDAFDPFEDGKTNCIVLVPPEKLTHGPVAWMLHVDAPDFDSNAEYHLPPEIFISDGPPGTIVGDWVAERRGIGGVHHMAYQVDSVEEMMLEAKEKGWFGFSSAEPMRCPGLIQVFTKPLAFAGGMVLEFIEREGNGVCRANVRRLMESTK